MHCRAYVIAEVRKRQREIDSRDCMLLVPSKESFLWVPCEPGDSEYLKMNLNE